MKWKVSFREQIMQNVAARVSLGTTKTAFSLTNETKKKKAFKIQAEPILFRTFELWYRAKEGSQYIFVSFTSIRAKLLDTQEPSTAVMQTLSLLIHKWFFFPHKRLQLLTASFFLFL